MLTAQNWTNKEDQVLTAESLEALFRNYIPVIRISQFATKEECQKLVEAAESVGFYFYEGLEPPLGRIGITQSGFGNSGKLEYFDSVRQVNYKIQKVFSLAFNPLERLVMLFRQHSSTRAEIAKENDDLGQYCPGLIQHANEFPLHFDLAKYSAPDWKIGRCVAQLALTLYIKVPENGGECVVYKRPWSANDEKYKDPDAPYIYDMSVVKGSEAKSIAPALGDLVLFNSRNFHQVMPGKGERIVIILFIGKMPEGDLVFWA